jgi:hypothetical protein
MPPLTANRNTIKSREKCWVKNPLMYQPGAT